MTKNEEYLRDALQLILDTLYEFNIWDNKLSDAQDLLYGVE